MSNTIRFEVAEDGIATLTIDVPDRSMNVLTPEFLGDLAEAVEKVAADDNIKGALITSGKKAFIAGADLKDLVTAHDRGVSVEEGYQWSQHLSKLYRRMETCGKPFAAAINGTALGSR